MVRPLLAAIALGVIGPGAAALAGPSSPSPLSQSDVRAEYGPAAPSLIVTRLQESLASDPSPLFRALPADLKGHPFSMVINGTPRGVDVKVQISGSAGAAQRAAKAVAVPLTDVAQEVGGDYAEQTTVTSPGFAWPSFPTLSLPQLALPHLAWPQWPGGSGRHTTTKAVAGALLACTGAGLGVFLLGGNRRASGRRLPLATFWGAPVLGLLPQSLARVGKLYHLQSKPCQALSHFFGQRAANTREFVIAGPSPEASGTVAVCLGLFGVRQGERVLLVDVSERNPVIPAILARFGPPPEPGDGAVGTSIPDLDLMIAPAGRDGLPEIPPDLAQQYVRILYVPAPGARPKGKPVVDIVSKLSFSQGVKAAFAGNRLGWVFFGDGVPLRISDRYYTRYYYERLHDVSGPVTSS